MYTELSRDEFLRRYGNLFHALYCGRHPSKSSFRNNHWRFAMTTGCFLHDRGKFEALSRAIKSVGDEEIIITEHSPAGPGHQISGIISSNYQDYQAAMEADLEVCNLPWLPYMNTAIFGPSGSWAAIRDSSLHLSSGYTVFAAEDKVMDAWLKALGGVDGVRQDFVDSWDWPDLPADYQLDPEVINTLLADVGW